MGTQVPQEASLRGPQQPWERGPGRPEGSVQVAGGPLPRGRGVCACEVLGFPCGGRFLSVPALLLVLLQAATRSLVARELPLLSVV